MLYALALLAGVVAGLRAFTAPAAVSWALHLNGAHAGGTWLAFFGLEWTAWILTALAVLEYVTDQLPSTPSRKVPVQFGARLVTGGLSGAAIGATGGAWIGGLVAGLLGAVIGTYGGAATRTRIAGAFGRDLPAGLVEDAVAVALGFAIVMTLR